MRRFRTLVWYTRALRKYRLSDPCPDCLGFGTIEYTAGGDYISHTIDIEIEDCESCEGTGVRHSTLRSLQLERLKRECRSC